MKKIYNIVVTAIFLGFIFIVPLLTKMEPPMEYSLYENRNLAEPPVFSFSELFSGEYLPLWDEYFSDHIWKRNLAISQYTLLNMDVLDKVVVNDVVIRENLLLPYIEYPRETYDFEEDAEKMTDDLLKLRKRVEAYGGEFIYVGVPEQYSILRDYYPDYLNNDSSRLSACENAFFSRMDAKGIKSINMRTEFLKEPDYIRYYSKTDHHYNLYGAFFTYQTIISRVNEIFNEDLPILREDEITFSTLENPFYGSRGRKLYNMFDFEEKLYYYTQETPMPFTRTNNGNWVWPTVFMLPEDETSAVTFEVYMHGDIGETIIETERENLPNALLFGDSFTNPLETIFYNSFNETRSLDMRNYSKMTLLEYIDIYKPDYVFCLRDDTAYLNFDDNGDI